MILNCDIGERGADHPVDRDLLPLIDLANIACGGHAGDAGSVDAFACLARRHGVRLAAHLSYPDRASFGRATPAIATGPLLASLSGQRALLPTARILKLHGALYNDTVYDAALATAVADWCASAGFDTVVTMKPGALATACAEREIGVLAEAFAERRYVAATSPPHLRLMPRREAEACIAEVAGALAQARRILRAGQVPVGVRRNADGSFGYEDRPVVADTLCVHSDSPIALPLVRALRELVHRRDA